jgi:hypothetical protein
MIRLISSQITLNQPDFQLSPSRKYLIVRGSSVEFLAASKADSDLSSAASIDTGTSSEHLIKHSETFPSSHPICNTDCGLS